MANDPTRESAPADASKGIEDLQKYLLRSSREVVQLLRALAQKPDLITARIPSTSSSVITAVLDVLPKKNLVVFDYGPNEALNKKMLKAERIVFSTRHDLVDTRFSCAGVKRVKYRSGPAFAASIPDSIMYLQRREYFRIKPLISHPVFCLTPRGEQTPLKLKVLDLCVKGLALQDNQSLLRLEAGDRIDDCKLSLPANPTLNVTLEVKYLTDGAATEGHPTTRIGTRFVNLQQRDEFALQRFINMVQMEQNALAKG